MDTTYTFCSWKSKQVYGYSYGTKHVNTTCIFCSCESTEVAGYSYGTEHINTMFNKSNRRANSFFFYNLQHSRRRSIEIFFCSNNLNLNSQLGEFIFLFTSGFFNKRCDSVLPCTRKVWLKSLTILTIWVRPPKEEKKYWFYAHKHDRRKSNDAIDQEKAKNLYSFTKAFQKEDNSGCSLMNEVPRRSITIVEDEQVQTR